MTKSNERTGAGESNSGAIFISRPVLMTSSWFTVLDPALYARIGISRGTPRGQRGYRRYPKLNPGSWFSSVSPEEYKERYYREILNPLDPQTVVNELVALADGKIPALLCWEKSNTGKDWCHRGFVSAWLKDTLGIDVFEVGLEHEGCGHAHPKLPSSMRMSSGDLFD
jgi:hypothetical protein